MIPNTKYRKKSILSTPLPSQVKGYCSLNSPPLSVKGYGLSSPLRGPADLSTPLPS